MLQKLNQSASTTHAMHVHQNAPTAGARHLLIILSLSSPWKSLVQGILFQLSFE